MVGAAHNREPRAIAHELGRRDEARETLHGASTTVRPHGPWPTGIFLTTFRDAMSITDTSSDGPLDV